MDFGSLFKKFRLRSEFSTLTDLADELSRKGLVLEESTFSRWQKGNRIPQDRNILLRLIALFIERKGINSLKEANSLLESAGQGYLTDSEINSLAGTLLPGAPFQVPREIANFVGRTEYLQKVKEQIHHKQTILIYGQPGVGKTALAIKIGHMLRDEFKDGVLWYRVDTSSVMNILLVIAYTYGNDISSIKDVESRASIVRSILTNKKVLLILDNATKSRDLNFLIPNSELNSVIVTSNNSSIGNYIFQHKISLPTFVVKESLILFEKILQKKYVKRNKSKLIEISQLLGNLPLAIQLFAKQLSFSESNITKSLLQLKKQKLLLTSLEYERGNLEIALSISFNNLKKEEKQVFISLGVFAGGDFSLESVTFINNLQKEKAESILNKLIDNSLVEHSLGNRYRLHPMIKVFVKQKATSKILYKKAALYYKKYLEKKGLRNFKNYPQIRLEIDNILYIFRKAYQLKYWDILFDIWDYLGVFLWDSGLRKEMEKLGLQIYKAAVKIGNKKAQVLCCIRELSWFYYWQGDIDKAVKYTMEGLLIANEINDGYLIAWSKQRLGKVCQGTREFKKSINLLSEAYSYFRKIKDYTQLVNIFRYLAETYLLMKDVEEAKEYCYKSLKIADKTKDSGYDVITKTIIYIHLGTISLLIGNYSKAIGFFKSSLQLERNSERRGGSIIFNNIGLGLVYEKLDRKVESREYFKKAKAEILFLGVKKNIDKSSVIVPVLESELIKSRLYKSILRPL